MILTLETLSSGKVVAKKNGYVYVYTSNESQQDVLFDNLGVLDVTGPVLEETHYYPFLRAGTNPCLLD